MSSHSRKHAQHNPHPEPKPVVFGPVGRGIPVSPDSIRARAYQIFQSRIRNRTPGDAISDWLEAERELAGRIPPPAASEAEERARDRGERLLASAE